MPDKLEKAVAEISAKESTRIAALRSYGILDTPPEKVFDALAQLAASISGTPTALISFVDGQRQWFKARVGMSVHETPRDISFCTHAIGYDDLFIVPDAARDERFARNPLVTQNPRIRFYAGVPLITLEGQALGTLCVIDYVPRELTPEQQQALRDLSRYVMAQLDLRRRLAQFTRDNPVRQKTVASVRRALDENQFALYYQPTVDARNGHIAGLEAVLRWQCPERGLIGPKGFLPMLEDSGLIVEVGAWMLHQAARDYRDWLANGVTAPRIAVNVSSLQLQHPDFLATLEHAMDPDGMSRVPLDIEITEQVLLENDGSVTARLVDIQHMGVHITVDDFGTGYSSLRHLARLPVDTLKIDRFFVANMMRSPDDMGLISSIISLAHRLDLQVVAEGVETQEQRRLLHLLNCDQIQSLLFAPPLAAAEMECSLRRDQEQQAVEWSLALERLPAN